MTKILVVEDDTDIRNLLVDTIADMGFEVIEAEDGGIGLDKAISQRPDIILLDLMMPVMDGLQVLGELKAGPATQNIPVIMVSAKGQGEDVMKALTAGAWGYVIKPWDEGALELAVAGAQKLVRQGRAAAL
ncbi:MAG: response regulator [Chloroflexi bacterium]|nr:response regulator [Chloroflexota bacterium]